MNQRPYYLKPKRVFTEKSIQNDVYVLVENGTFREITSVPKPGIDTIYTDKSMLPGFLDCTFMGVKAVMLWMRPESLLKPFHYL